MTEEINEAVAKAHVLDNEIQTSLAKQKSLSFKAFTYGGACFLILLGASTYGVFRQNQIAIQNKKHIDCIIKDLATPPPKGASPNAKKYIDNLSTDCNIKFTQ